MNKNTAIKNPPVTTDIKTLFDYYISFCENEIAIQNGPEAGQDNKRQPWESVCKSLKWHSNINISSKAVIHDYVRSKSTHNSKEDKKQFIFPFGCNQSQKHAVENALTNSISVIQGPPGTGKTQTILNIIANLLVKGKTIAVVSNNNSATENVWEKLNNPAYDLGWLVARLGSLENQKKWFKNIPERRFKSYRGLTPQEVNERDQLNELIDSYYKIEVQLKEDEKQLRELLQQLRWYTKEEGDKEEQWAESSWYTSIKDNSRGSLEYLSKLQNLIEELATRPTGWRRLLIQFKFYFKRLRNLSAFEQDLEEKLGIVTLLSAQLKSESLRAGIQQKTDWLKQNKSALERFTELSKRSLLEGVYHHFGNIPEKKYESSNYRFDHSFFKRFPIITSSSYSLTYSSNRSALFDYLIIDEASQVNLPTAVLCMCYARNLVVVGDNEQLPVILSRNALQAPEDIPEVFNAAKYSVLDSLTGRMPETILREHYRCHPDIIEFCNRKFYNNQLICMTHAPTDAVAFRWIRSAIGAAKYADGSRFNEKQVADTRDAIDKLIESGVSPSEIGIIAPYRKHANLLACTGVLADTVHRYQGQERKHIIFNSVVDKLGDFVDDPHLINVAVSRAKDSFTLIAPQYENKVDSNLVSLIRYIEHLDPTRVRIENSKYRSVFEALFRDASIKTKGKSESPAEALFRELLSEVLEDKKYRTWRFVQEYPLRLLPRSIKQFSDEEVRFMLNGSRLDFLIYDSIDNQPIAVIEVDGAQFHKKFTRQAERDNLKDSILKDLGIPELRLRTDSLKGQEREQLETLLEKQYYIRNNENKVSQNYN